MTPIAQAVAIAGLTLGTGAATVSVLNEDIPDLLVPEMEWTDTPLLDGFSFAVDADLGNGETHSDVLRFVDGGFISEDCERYCNFGYSDYQTWTDGEVIHVTATARCPTAPHTTVWYGQIAHDQIEVQLTWTTRRWYWTHQIEGVGSGARLANTTPSG